MRAILLGLILGSAVCAPVNGPRSVLATCNDVTIRIDGPKLWTLSRIEYKGTQLSTESSAYGTVASFPGIGIIGSAHLDNGKEEVLDLRFSADGATLSAPPDRLICNWFQLVRKSRIGGLDVENTTEVRDNRLYETTIIRAARETSLDFLYNFMHAWETDTSSYLAETPDGEVIRGDLQNGDEFLRVFYINKEVKWIGVYNRARGGGAVSKLLDKPSLGGAITMLWNCPPAYRKFYLKSFGGGTIPAGFSGTYKLVTGFFDTSQDQWEKATRNLAAQLN